MVIWFSVIIFGSHYGMSNKEKVLIDKCIVEATKRGDRLFRNNTGMGWTGNTIKISKPQTIYVDAGDVVIKNARPLRAGLIKGSPDTIGWTLVKVTKEMIGKILPIFTGPEMKTGKQRLRKEQKAFQDYLKSVNGIAVTVYKPEDIEEEIEQWKKRISHQ